MMNAPVSKELCDARYGELSRDITEIKKSVTQIFGRINAFYVTLVFVLLTQLTVIVFTRNSAKSEIQPIHITISKEDIQ